LPSEGLNFYTTAQQHRQDRGRASLQDLIFECRAFGIVRLEPLVRGDRIGKHLEIIGVASIRAGAVAELVGIEGGVVSGVINLESSGVEASDWRPRHDEQYHEA
jgi:hypothetical protein